MCSEPAAGPKTRRACLPPWLLWSALAAALLAIAWGVLQWMMLRAEQVTLRTELQLAQLSLQDAQQRREADRILWQYQIAALSRSPATAPVPTTALNVVLLAPPRAGSPSPLGAAAWDPTAQEVVFAAQNLSPPAPGQVYRLWLVDPQNPPPVAVGVVAVDPRAGTARGAFKLSQSLPAAPRFLLSLERPDGGPAPEGPVVLASP